MDWLVKNIKTSGSSMLDEDITNIWNDERLSDAEVAYGLFCLGSVFR